MQDTQQFRTSISTLLEPARSKEKTLSRYTTPNTKLVAVRISFDQEHFTDGFRNSPSTRAVQVIELKYTASSFIWAGDWKRPDLILILKGFKMGGVLNMSTEPL